MNVRFEPFVNNLFCSEIGKTKTLQRWATFIADEIISKNRQFEEYNWEVYYVSRLSFGTIPTFTMINLNMHRFAVKDISLLQMTNRMNLGSISNKLFVKFSVPKGPDTQTGNTVDIDFVVCDIKEFITEALE